MKSTHTLEVLGVLLVDEGGKVTSVVENHVEGLAVGKSSNGLLDTPVVLLLGLALPGEDGHTSGGDTENEERSVDLHEHQCRITRTRQQRGPGWRRCSKIESGR